MTMTTFDLVCLGEPLVEFNQRFDLTDTYVAGYGGDTSNCAIAAARMGARVAYLTQVGDDAFGDQFMHLWQAEGVYACGVKRVPGGQTGIYFVTHTSQGHSFTYRRAGSAASLMAPGSFDLSLLSRTRGLHVSGISQAISTSACDVVFEALKLARQHGARISYDLNFRPRLWPAARALAIAEATLPQCDLFFPSIDEVQTLTGLGEPAAILAWAHEQGVPQVVLKLGADGCLVSHVGNTPIAVPGRLVEAIDATGAGDCFAGALLARLAAGDHLVQAARAANVAAALSTQGLGAVAPLPRWTQVQALLA